MIIERSDWRCLFFLAVTLGLLVAGQFIPLGWWTPPLMLLTCLWCAIISLVNHNQIHLSVFKGAVPNVIYNILMSPCLMLPATAVYVPHVINHHTYICGPEDWSGVHLAGEHRGFLRYLIYTLRTRVAITKKNPWQLAKRLPRERRVSFVLESVTVLAVIAAGLWFGPLTFILHWFLPAYFGVNLFIVYNLFLHDGCDSESRFNHSQNFVSPIENFFLLNSAFHTAHHNRPRLHWSKLPAYHEEHLRGAIDSKFQHQSILL